MKNKAPLLVIILLLVVMPIITCLFVGTVIFTFFIPFFSPSFRNMNVASGVPIEVTTPITSSTSSVTTSVDIARNLSFDDIKKFKECILWDLYDSNGKSKHFNNNENSGYIFDSYSRFEGNSTNIFLNSGYYGAPSVVSTSDPFSVPITDNKDSNMVLIWNYDCKFTLYGTENLRAKTFLDLPNKKIYMIETECIYMMDDLASDVTGCYNKDKNIMREYDLTQRKFTKNYEITVPSELVTKSPTGYSDKYSGGYTTGEIAMNEKDKLLYIS
ncbi:MAG: hypothetical protein WCK31_01425, partial [bacterium]